MGEQKNSGLGIAAFVCSLLGCTSLIGLILGIISVATAKKNNTKTGLPTAAIIISIIWMLGSFFMVGVIGGASDDADKANKTGEVTTEVKSDSKDEGTKEEKTEAAKDNHFKVGDIVETDNLKMTYLSCEQFTGYSEFSAPKDGYVIYRMEFEVENISDTDQYASVYDFECFADDYAMDAHYEEDDLSASLSAGKKAKGAVYFEVPEDAQSATLEYETNFWTENKIIFIIK